MSGSALNMNFLARENLWDDYYEKAEPDIDWQWDKFIWPNIKDFDFNSVLELGPGGGRNTRKLSEHAGRLVLVEYKKYAIDKCRERFGDNLNGVPMSYIVNNGRDLRDINNDSITAVYCWDSAVHFDRNVVEDYVHEFARIMTPGAKGFVHHSNLGSKANPDIRRNPHWRSNMTKELFAGYCKEAGLILMKQVDVPWDGITDCASIFAKPSN